MTLERLTVATAGGAGSEQRPSIAGTAHPVLSLSPVALFNLILFRLVLPPGLGLRLGLTDHRRG